MSDEYTAELDKELNEASGHRSMGAELVIPVGALGFILYYFITIIDSPWTAQVSAVFVGSILVVLVLAFMLSAVRVVRRGEGDWGFAELSHPASFVNTRLFLLALTIGYIVVISWLGFTITTFLFLFMAMALLNKGERMKLSLIVAAALSVSGYLLFIVAFKTRFPFGPFENLLEPLLGDLF